MFQTAAVHDELIDNASETSRIKLTDDTVVKYELPEKLFDTIELVEADLLHYLKRYLYTKNNFLLLKNCFLRFCLKKKR